jgi:hypothetical protein
MIDCGAKENFIDREYARQNQIPLLRKTHEALLDVAINNHEETVRLQCITIGNSSVIVGLPWLRKHNPAIDWKENRVSFSSEYCAKKCLDTSPHAVTDCHPPHPTVHRNTILPGVSDNPPTVATRG